MSVIVWLMMGIAVWHFTVFVPDRFRGGIVGAFLAGAVGAALFGFAVNGLTVPGRSETELVQAFIAIPGALIGLGSPTSGAPGTCPRGHRSRPDARGVLGQSFPFRRLRSTEWAGCRASPRNGAASRTTWRRRCDWPTASACRRCSARCWPGAGSSPWSRPARSSRGGSGMTR